MHGLILSDIIKYIPQDVTGTIIVSGFPNILDSLKEKIPGIIDLPLDSQFNNFTLPPKIDVFIINYTRLSPALLNSVIDPQKVHAIVESIRDNGYIQIFGFQKDIHTIPSFPQMVITEHTSPNYSYHRIHPKINLKNLECSKDEGSLVNGEGGSMINEEMESPRVAILLVGLTRRFRDCYPMWKKYIFDTFAAQGITLDVHICTWNIHGDYKYGRKNFDAPISENWVSTDELSSDDLASIKELYKPVTLTIEDYPAWNSAIKAPFKAWINRHHINAEPLRIFNGIFAQYYQVARGWDTVSAYCQEKGVKYSMILRSRFDLEILDDNKICWKDMISVSQKYILSLEPWDRNGMRGNLIAACPALFDKYASLYKDLEELTHDDIKQIRLTSLVTPKYIFNYVLYDKDGDTMTPGEIHTECLPYLQKSIVEFVSDPNNLIFKCSIIPEVFLRYYITKIKYIPVCIHNWVNAKVLDSGIGLVHGKSL